ncbi:protein HGH1 homolog [Anneissia japonica]|uniref:protein HGH1 homolog n=1 Tax=Anneissia japonica TaxID=1529436 RepID=UPI0014258FAD|nr:protein HGH1 homolog [Anneissia japonica]XP_033099512.1 protein HGH1 homolog [Anneissia japonica]
MASEKPTLSKMNKTELEEFFKFLSPSARIDVKAFALDYVLGLTGSAEGKAELASDKRYIECLFSLTKDTTSSIVKDSYITLLSLSADDIFTNMMITNYCIVPSLLEYIVDEESNNADTVCMLVANLTRNSFCCRKFIELIDSDQCSVKLAKIVEVFCQRNYNKKGNNLDHLGLFLSNITQVREGRKFILDRNMCVVQRLVPYTEYEASEMRRGGVVGALRNCCFETDDHEWLLSDKVDILPHLLLPLAGPEEISEEEMEGMPDDLQYLGEDKKREPNPNIRKMLIESICQLCSTKEGRQIVKGKRTYVIIRELHKSEDDKEVGITIEHLVQLLIGDEPEEGMENLNKVDIPPDVKEKLDKLMEEDNS